MKRVKIPHRHKALFLGLGALALVLLGVTAGFVVLLSGAYTTAATKQHFALTYKVLDMGLIYSVRAAAADIDVPDLQRPEMIRQGLVCYRKYCVQCHGAPAVPRDDLGKGMLPAPSNLSQSAREWPAAHLFYVTQKGVRMAGMPAWEFRISEAGLWSTVAFLKRMPFLTHAQYQELGATAGGESCPRNIDAAVEYSHERGRTVLRQYACDNCHRIDGMVGPDAHVGPPLTQWSRRKYIAGILPNTNENLVTWIVRPQSISSATLMPDLGVPEAHAREMARYLMEAK
jgi:mono/diheme cytochrome c family protein